MKFSRQVVENPKILWTSHMDGTLLNPAVNSAKPPYIYVTFGELMCLCGNYVKHVLLPEGNDVNGGGRGERERGR